jgi:hypothetical protein
VKDIDNGFADFGHLRHLVRQLASMSVVANPPGNGCKIDAGISEQR